MQPASVSCPFSAMTRPPYPPAHENTGSTPGASCESLKFALKANRSPDLLLTRRLRPGSPSHEPLAMINTGARNSVSSGAGRASIPHRNTPALRSKMRLHHAVPAIEGDLAQLRTGQLCKCVADSERRQKRKVARADAGATNLAPREGLFFNQRYRPSRRGKQNCSRAAGRPRTDNDGVVTGLHACARRTAANVCEKSRAPASLNCHPPSSGQHAESSPSLNPARTLSTASRRVTSLAPMAPTRWLPNNATRARRGSQAMKQSVIRVMPRNSRDNASPSKWCTKRLATTASKRG